MKLSDNTLSVLKNYANINQNLLITAGSTLSTMSVQKNIFAKAEISETFDRDVAIYDLNEFLASVTGMSDPDLDFKDDFILVTNNNGDKLEFYYSDPSVVSSPTTEITMPDAEITIEDLAGDENHYSATIKSKVFSGKNKIEQHKMVYKALKNKVGNELHALSINTVEV